MTTFHRFLSLRSSPRRRATVVGPSPRTLAVLALVLANAIWGGSAAASKAALVHLPPLTTACLRVAIALAVLRLLLVLKGDRPATGRAPALLGLTGVAAFCASQNLGLRSASATTTALLSGAIPVLTAILATVFLGERLGGRRLTGLLVSLAGIAVLVVHGSAASLGVAALGNLLPLVSAASFAAYAVLGRQIFAGGDALAIVAGSTRYGLLFLLPGALVEAATSDLGPITALDLALLVFLGAGCSAFAFVLAGYGLSLLEASQGAVLGNLKPLVGVALAVVLLGEPLTGRQLCGGLLVLLGVGIASQLRTASRAEAPPATSSPSPLSPRYGRHPAVPSPATSEEAATLAVAQSRLCIRRGSESPKAWRMDAGWIGVPAASSRR